MTEQNHRAANKVLVVGGGVGGMKAALDLAEAGRGVVMIDKAPSIGGLMTQLDRTFPTNNCDMCTVSPHLAQSGRSIQEIDLELKPLTVLEACEGEAGQFTVTLKTAPRYIDTEKCTACGICHQQFPECVSFDPGLDPRAPTCMRYPQATPLAFSIDLNKCADLDALVACCPADAIVPDQKPSTETLDVASMVLAPGAGLFDPDALANYGHGVYPNVVTGLEYERIMSASGPTGGRLVRPSDEKQPLKVAWIQCVGSRNINQADAPYCSSVCCMYALKEAVVTKERFQDDIEAVVFYMDMRTSGKDYELYLERAKNDYDVRLVRCRPHSVVPHPGSDDIDITYTTEESSDPNVETFDMVVLSTGFKVPEDAAEMGRKLGIDLNRYNFAQTSYFNPVATSKPGVYVCGLYESPKDIPHTMVQASAAAGMAALHAAPLTAEAAAEAPEDEYAEYETEAIPAERAIEDEEPRVGVFVCECGESIGGVVRVADLIHYAEGLPEVVHAESVGYGCSRPSLEHIEETIRDKGVNRIVIGGCSPRTHEIKFQDTARRTGLNKYMVEMANLRDQDTWVHADRPEAALEKGKELLHMASSSVAARRPLPEYTLSINKDVLVVGGGPAGMSAALSLGDQGLRVFLVEKSPRLGGNALNVRKTLAGQDVRAELQNMIDRVQNHDRIQVLTSALIVDHAGMPGRYKTGIQFGPQMAYRQIEHGGAVLATGALAHRPSEYLLDQHDAVLTQLDLDSVLEDDPDRIKKLNQVVMIQCVGSRVPENPNCSRLCCGTAIKNALRIKEINPDARVFILNRDIRTYGFSEDYYRAAREKGVIFVHYTLDSKPGVEAEGDRVTVRFTDPILGREIQVGADMLALSTGFVADEEDTEDLAMIFHLPRTDDGYFLEEHVKLRPVDLALPGFTVAGTAHSPKDIKESIGQGLAAAGRVKAILAKDEINLGASKARVEAQKCAACLICVRACPFDVPYINADGYSEIDPAKCHGCGICAAACPAKAIELLQYEDDQILAKVFGLLEGVVNV